MAWTLFWGASNVRPHCLSKDLPPLPAIDQIIHEFAILKEREERLSLDRGHTFHKRYMSSLYSAPKYLDAPCPSSGGGLLAVFHSCKVGGKPPFRVQTPPTISITAHAALQGLPYLRNRERLCGSTEQAKSHSMGGIPLVMFRTQGFDITEQILGTKD